MPPINPDRMRILVIEDDPAYRDLAREALAGHERWIASTAREGLELFHAHLPDIVFLDLSLPDENGLQVLLEMRENHPESYIVMLTASRMTDDVLLAQRCAANGYVTKPFSRKQLQAYCDSCIKHWTKLDEMDYAARAAFRARIRSETMKMQSMLHAPTPEAKAALQQLMPRWNILVVGEKSGEAGEWLKILHNAGCQVASAESGVTALDRLKDQPFRLMLTQDELPDMEAAELLYRLRVNQQSLPAVVVVDAEWKLRQTKWRKVGANHIVAAPLSSERLRALVEREIARSLHEIDEVFLKL